VLFRSCTRRSSRSCALLRGRRFLLRVDVVAPVLLPRFFVVTERLRLLGAEADRSDLLALHAQVGEVLLGGIGPALAEREVVLLGAALVGVALDANPEVRVLRE